MDIVEEYKRQASTRRWGRYVDSLPLRNNDTILDLGCGTGDVSVLLARKASTIIGIDNNAELLLYAERNNKAENIHYIHHDIRDIDSLKLGSVDGIWSSFTAAYFPDFMPILTKWLRLLKQGGWIALTEVDDLFAHEPMDNAFRELFGLYYEKQRKGNIYDFRMGSKLKDYLLQSNITIVHEENMHDSELSCNGILEHDIVALWEARFKRMTALQVFFGEERLDDMKTQFLSNLRNERHVCNCKVVYVMGKKM